MLTDEIKHKIQEHDDDPLRAIDPAMASTEERRRIAVDTPRETPSMWRWFRSDMSYGARTPLVWGLATLSGVAAFAGWGVAPATVLLPCMVLVVTASIVILRRRERILFTWNDQLRRREAIARVVVTEVPAALWESSRDGVSRVFLNDVLHDSFPAMTSAASSTMSEAWTKQLLFADRESVVQRIRSAVASDASYAVEYRLRDRDGCLHWMLEQGCRTSSGRYVGTIISSDAARARCETLQEELEAAHCDAEALERQRKALTTKCEKLEQTVDEVRDELLRTREVLDRVAEQLVPAAEGVIGTTELLCGTDLDDAQRCYVDIARCSCDTLVALISGAFDPEHIDEHLAVAQQDRWSFRSLLDEAVETAESVARDRAVSFTCEIDNNVPDELADDRGRLRQMLLYLFNTASRFSDGTSLAIRVTRHEQTSEDTPEMTQEVQRVRLRIEARCEGGGIPDPVFNALAMMEREEQTNDDVEDEEPMPLLRSFSLRIVREMARSMGGGLEATNNVDDDKEGFVIVADAVLERAADQFANARAHARMRQDTLTCSIGRVEDLSLGGLRASCRGSKPPSDMTEIALHDDEHELTLPCEIVWTKKAGFRRWELGVRFHDLTAAQTRELTRISMSNRTRRIFDAA